MSTPRTTLLQLPDSDLLKLCEVSAYKGSGPGGQHRNKTNSGVKLKLKMGSGEWGVDNGQWTMKFEVYACEDRSAHVNKLHALKKLRMKIALQIREEPTAQIPFDFPGSNGKISQDNKLFLQFIADVLDRIYAANGELNPAAQIWGLSKSALDKIITPFLPHRERLALKLTPKF